MGKILLFWDDGGRACTLELTGGSPGNVPPTYPESIYVNRYTTNPKKVEYVKRYGMEFAFDTPRQMVYRSHCSDE
jgi:hypothetical protein